MKARFSIALSMVVGATLGGAAIEALHAQAKPPVYMIAINEVTDPDRYAKEYVPPAQQSVKDHGGEYIAAGPGNWLPEIYLKGQLSSFAGKAWRRYKVGAILLNFRPR